MDASLNTQLSLAACAMSAAALFVSLLTAFPGLKGVLAAVRDGVLWFALFLVLGAGGYWVWSEQRRPSHATSQTSTLAPPAIRASSGPVTPP